ncbi:molecular chaperone DnaJ [Vallitalea longa]|uniref:Molecular chaperone DnaJ n=1 Tax=Vallitalea longa TaxID=2936439 RepID=A0A9W6DE02_9FIRM|nr:molecular chaperone DnaJ [Vallitalea longa]GKX27857.1 molecular chaperone DnaJ [Vallitalea longa]
MFSNVNTLEELKKEYRRLARKFHPDNGGSLEKMKELNNEFDRLSKTFSNQENVEFNSETFRNIINSLSQYDITIEIIGTWIWVSGNTYKIKDKLKELKFKWSRNKKSWYWYEGEYKKHTKKQFTMSDIKSMHGCKVVKQGTTTNTNFIGARA